MMRIILTCCIWYFTCSSFLYAQSYIPFTFLKAIDNETRTPEGNPGREYFQNHAKYNIEAKFNPRTGELSGEAIIQYFNNSNDTLRRLIVH